MKKIFSSNLFLTAAVLSILLPNFARAESAPQASDDARSAIEKTRRLLGEIIEKSFPELDAGKIKVKAFRSRSNFFKARFSLTRYLTFRSVRTTVFVNPLVFERDAPEQGVRAILAHELAHALYYKEKNRLELLGLVSLIKDGFTAKFERRTDLAAIKRGWGEGLIAYREWLYKNVPPENLAAKKRDYFTPEELRVLIPAIERKPELIKMLLKKVPRNLTDVQMAVKF